MLKLLQSLKAWGGPEFHDVLRRELELVAASVLPLQQGLSHSSVVSDAPCQVMIINVKEEQKVINVKVGVFYQGVIAGCSCADDPTPDHEQAEYCVLELSIDKATAETQVELLEA